MKITKKIESEILLVMEDYWGSYLRGDFQNWASYLPDNYGNIGTTKEEIWKNKKEILDYTERISEQVVGTAEIRNKISQFIPYGPYIMVHEIGDMFVKAEEGWIYYAQVRLSSLLEKSKNGWKILHQHGSYPDSKADDGEAYGFEELKTENKNLRDAIQRRTIELERNNRQLEIETALERVRGVAMSMKTVIELQEVGEIIFTALKTLGFSYLRNTEIIINQEGKSSITSYYYSDYGVTGIIDVDYNTNPTLKKWTEDIQEADDAFSEVIISEKEIKDWRDYRLSLGYVPDPKLDEASSVFYYSYSIGLGALSISSFEPIKTDDIKILEQFRNVFNLAYQRYNDLALAEAQAREAQIEAALEKVRSRSLAVNRSDEFNEVVTVVFEKLSELDIPTYSVTINVFKDDTKDWDVYGCGTSENGLTTLHFTIPYFSTPILDDIMQVRRNSVEGFFSKTYSVEDKTSYYKYVFNETELKNLPDDIKQTVWQSKAYTASFAYSKHSMIGTNDFEGGVLEEGQIDILKRFSKVFEQAYIRFLDLQKAEAQAREAQVETCLERVRSRSMAMHDSSEMLEVADVLFQQIRSLGGNLWGCGVLICKPDSNNDEVWFANEKGVLPPIVLPHNEDPTHKKLYEGWQNKLELYAEFKEGKELRAHYDYMLSVPTVKPLFEDILASGLSFPTWQKWHAAYFSHGYLLIITLDHYEDERIFTRFAKVFNQAYTRFLDLQKAEEQAREAQIEAALERVRSRSLAMHHTHELQEVISTVHEELLKLDISVQGGSFIAINDDIDTELYCWGAGGTANTSQLVHVPHFGMPFCNNLIKGIKNGPGFFTEEFTQQEKEEYFTELFKHSPWSELSNREKNITLRSKGGYTRSCCVLDHTSILIINHSGRKFSKDENNVLKRFSKVFEQAYIRFMDLQKAEEQAREAKIEVALEKIRSQVTAMQGSTDLFDIVVSMRKEFISLGHEADYFWHMRWLSDKYEMSMTSEDGNRIGMVITVPKFVHEGIESLHRWEQSNSPSFVLALDGKAAWDYIDKMNTYGHYEKVDPHAPTEEDIHHLGGLTFILARTSHGEIGFSLAGEVPTPPKESLETLERFAGVFDLAYRRFEDLKEAENKAQKILEERDRLEKALSELKATQTQLIHAEKMASLGELTAGIAHEIQNPLNFVNNFSEVSEEMIDEVNEEMDSGDVEEAKMILQDLKSNLEKIHHHGKRADSIVKGMLMHSSSNKGEKMATDINDLCDEFLRLSYHGLRAKDRNFNAEFETHFDESIPRIEVVPQDIGRVLLNLINNAFQASVEKPLQGIGALEGVNGLVKVTTKNLGDKVRISVSDNGPGIPDNIKDKIFQPFFTTKPTGEGTGLGLSLAYDIVKAHGGELKVETKEGEGCEFIMHIPIIAGKTEKP